MNLPQISICIPVYRVEKYIERCARSLFTQTYTNIEYIFVDDCGKDKSIEILERIVAEYPEKTVRVLHHEHNRGLAAARNTAVDAAHGEWIMHVDSDDWIEPDAVEALMARQQETGADIVSGNALAHYGDREELLKEPMYQTKEEMLLSLIQLSLNHVVWRRLIRHSLYTDYKIHATEGVNVGEDHHTMPRLVYYAKSFAILNKVVYHYNCENVNSYTNESSYQFNLKRYYNDCDSIAILLEFFKDKDAACYASLLEILCWYNEHGRNGCVRKGDYKAYTQIAKDLGYSNFSYWPYRLLILACKLIRKITGITLEPLRR